MTEDSQRKEQAYLKRVEAAELARDRSHPSHESNGDEQKLCDADGNFTYIASFTKGLPHDKNTGLLKNTDDYELFVKGIETGAKEDLQNIPLGPNIKPLYKRYQAGISRANNLFPTADSRAWESMAAGHAFDLEGPDAQAVTMPPAPTLHSDELVTEISELYWMALIRDIPFFQFRNNHLISKAIESLKCTSWIQKCDDSEELSGHEKKRLRGQLSLNSLFRGKTPGDRIGPYISQFLLIGNKGIEKYEKPEHGYVQYGAMRMDQRVRVSLPRRDYMTTWESFIDAQNGADLRGRERYIRQGWVPGYRFIFTPRDLCTYVHYDALYQAYLNACIIMLSMGIPFDKGVPFQKDDDSDKQQGFAHFGGPHILSLVTEVATRALKAVRFQKFNIHRRARPEAICGLIERYSHDPECGPFQDVKHLYDNLDEQLLKLIEIHNRNQNKLSDFGRPRSKDYSPEKCSHDTKLLPMAFAEGSPMHPSYGAGHATVAGACVTVLKAWFDHTATLPFAYISVSGGSTLKNIRGQMEEDLTIEGELNKLCSNISIGRNWAGVHYYSDYYESILLGEKIALGILEEQKLCFKEDFSLTIPLFDGSEVTI